MIVNIFLTGVLTFFILVSYGMGMEYGYRGAIELALKDKMIMDGGKIYRIKYEGETYPCPNCKVK